LFFKQGLPKLSYAAEDSSVYLIPIKKKELKITHTQILHPKQLETLKMVIL
jgi:hypothetical protein